MECYFVRHTIIIMVNVYRLAKLEFLRIWLNIHMVTEKETKWDRPIIELSFVSVCLHVYECVCEKRIHFDLVLWCLMPLLIYNRYSVFGQLNWINWYKQMEKAEQNNQARHWWHVVLLLSPTLTIIFEIRIEILNWEVLIAHYKLNIHNWTMK